MKSHFLAENSGLSPIETLTSLKAQHVTEKNSYLGVDCMNKGTNDMKQQHVFDPLISKREQFLLATQLVKMVLKIDDVIAPGALMYSTSIPCLTGLGTLESAS